MRFLPGFCLLLVSAVVGAEESGAPLSLLHDSSFSEVTDESLSPWQVRFALKASEPSSRPRWKVVPRVDDDAAHGKHLSVEQIRPAAGTVYVGQRVRLPGELPLLELSVDYQTYCAMAGRSGGLSAVVFAPEVWDGLSRDPERVQPPPEETLFSFELHRNGEKVTEWRRRRVPPAELRTALVPLAGREVVVALAWSTWHPSSNEWARFDNFWLGEPQPSIESLNWPSWAYVGEPLVLTALATGRGERRAELAYRAAGTEVWTTTTMEAAAKERFEGTLPAAAMTGPIQVRAVLKQANAADLATSTVEIRMTRRPTHPCLFYDSTELKRMREKVDEFAWARETFDGLRAKADAWLERSDDPPAEPGGWSHNYACPEDGARLKFREDKPHAHLCPSCEKEWTGEKYDGVWRGTIHGRFASGARDLALTYQLTGDERYAKAAARIVLWYADHYVDFPLGKGPAGKGRVMSQSLSECTWLIRMMDAADLAYEVMSPDERRHVETDLIRAGAEHIWHYKFGIHNIQCWHNSCMACAGYFLGDPDMIARAREGKLGFDEQVKQGILDDGMWFERSLGYHNYTLGALIAHCEPARHAGEKLYEQGRIRRMFTLPLMLAQPNLVPPSLNDQGYSRGRIGPEALERAVAWYGDKVAARALKKLYADGRKRGGLTALQYGEELPEVGEYQPPDSIDLPGAGLAILRQGKGDSATCAMLEYGEHGGGHGHPDKLQLILYGLGQTLCPDPGTTGYGSPLHGKWFKQTAAHNGVTIGTRSQSRTTGKLLAFEANDLYAAATAESTGAYTGYRIARHLLLTDSFLVDIFEIEGDEPDTLDWFLRAPGKCEVSLPLEPLAEDPPNATYAYLTDLRAASTDDQWTATWTVDDKGNSLAVTMLPCLGTQVAHCLAPGVPGEPTWHTVRVRRTAAGTRFVAVYQMLKPGAEQEAVQSGEGMVSIGNVTVKWDDQREAALRLK